jgi:hypothetical protein
MSELSDERWLPVVGWETLYEISSFGRVKSLHCGVRSGVTLKPRMGTKGYLVVSLSNGIKQTFSIHKLVLEAFVGPRPDGHECCHGDGDPTNNCLSNLRWDTQLANYADKVKHGTHCAGERNGRAKLTPEVVRAIRDDPRVQREIAADYGICQASVSHIKHQKRWSEQP